MNIIINQLQKNFGPKVAVDIENYSIQGGNMLGLVGNNGAGKTTLFRLMLDLLKADGGSVHIGNIDVSWSEEWKNITGSFIDEGFLIDYLTPEVYFYFVGKMYGLTKEEVDKRVARFERFMNGEVIGQKKLIRNYSAGNKQKIGIISAMLHQPQVLVLLPKNYPPSYNFGPRAGLRGATFGCAFFSLGGSTIRSLSFSVLRS